MTDTFDDMFSNEPTSVTEEATNENTAETVENVETVEATPEGKTEAEAVTPAPTVETVEHNEEKKASIPLDVLLEERAKRQEAQKRLEEYERKEREALEAKASRPTTEPDPIDDPQAYTAHVLEQANRIAEEKLFQYRLSISEQAARKEHGDEAVQKAAEWFAERIKVEPGFRDRASTESNPVEWVVQQHRKHALFSEFQTDPDSVIRREAARLGLIAPATAAPATVATVTPNGSQVAAQKSIMDAPAASARTTTTTSSDPFDSFL